MTRGEFSPTGGYVGGPSIRPSLARLCEQPRPTPPVSQNTNRINNLESKHERKHEDLSGLATLSCFFTKKSLKVEFNLNF